MKRCSKCGETKPLDNFNKDKGNKDGLACWCRSCRKECQRAYCDNNKDKIKEKSRQYYREHTEEMKEYGRKWSAANPEKVREHWQKAHATESEWQRGRRRRWYEANHERALETSRKWYAANPEKAAEYNRKWIAENSERAAARIHARRMRILGSNDKITEEEIRWLKEYYDYTCLCCGRKEPEIKLTLDHVVPVKLGGRNTIENAQPLCKSCNSRKHIKIIDYRKEKALL